MRRLPFEAEEHVRVAVEGVAEVIGGSGVVLLPTETFYGLATSPDDPAGVERIRALKGRPEEMALPVLCADMQQVEELVEVPDAFRVRLSRSWPAALTVVLPARRRLPASRRGTLAVRIPAHRLLRALLYRVGALTGTSANRHGAPSCVTTDDALRSLRGAPDLCLEGGATLGGEPSTVVDLTGASDRLLRPGAFPWAEYRVVR